MKFLEFNLNLKKMNIYLTLGIAIAFIYLSIVIINLVKGLSNSELLTFGLTHGNEHPSKAWLPILLLAIILSILLVIMWLPLVITILTFIGLLWLYHYIKDKINKIY